MKTGGRRTNRQTPSGSDVAAPDKATAHAPRTKRSFDIDLAMQRIGEAVRPFPKAALFELFDDGYTTPFEQLVACIISIRTYDEVMIKTARSLFAVARTPHEISRLTAEEIDR